MKSESPFQTSITEPFIRNSGNLKPLHNRLCKTGNIVILICRQGQAIITIDLQEYEVVNNTVMFFFPDTIVSLTKVSPDFSVSYFTCLSKMFQECTFRFNPQFFHFVKEHPHKTLSSQDTLSIEELMKATEIIYADRSHCFRYEIAKNLLQIFLMDLYDKSYRWFTPLDIEGRNRPDEIFKKFMVLVHTHCFSRREVSFYANNLCISTKYLTDICRAVTGKSSKKIIDNFNILEIKVLLQNTELSIQAISEQLNFPDQSYLGRYFKRHEGISPLEYRNVFSKRKGQ